MKTSKTKIIAAIITRTFFFIPFLLIAFFGAVFLFLTWMINFIRFGGEAITYTRKTSRKTISDVYNKLQEIQNEKK
jgi:uncharacterized membrane protein